MFNKLYFADQQHKGNLFTLFLHSPLTAVCFICNITDIPQKLWEKGQSHIDDFMSEASRLLVKCRNIGKILSLSQKNNIFYVKYIKDFVSYNIKITI